ncbi:MAG: hypothetical protein LUG84_01290 [Akkermansiaceae bacterium]|nr:hypothetical protein [Akkermansiaceae bacterium]
MMELLHNPAFVLFGILFIDILLGNIRFCGLTLGSSGVLFVALAAGRFGLGVPEGVGGIGTALFVYCVGLSAGNRFFSSLAQAGNRLALLSLVVVTLVVALVLGHWGRIGPIMGYIPRETRTLLMELGLVLFLAWAGVAGGAQLVETLQRQGAAVFLIGAAITLAPLAAGWFFCQKSSQTECS